MPLDSPGTVSAASISLPKGGGALAGIGETFRGSLFTGTGNFTVPVALSPGRGGVGPGLQLEYSTGYGNGLFGMGWQLSLPRVSRKTEKGLPTYGPEDRFVLSGAEDLVPVLQPPAAAAGAWSPVTFTRGSFTVARFRPRTEGAFSRIEQWTRTDGEVHWRATTKANLTTIFGLSPEARIAHPDDPSRVYEWLIEETFDARGNHLLYRYARDARSPGQAYPRRVYYGNVHRAVGPFKRGTDHADPLAQRRRHYALEVVFDYGDLPAAPHDPYAAEAAGGDWLSAAPERPDAFSTYRPGFEVRTALRCRRVLMIHHFAELGSPTLVRSTDCGYDTHPGSLLSLLTRVTAVSYERKRTTYRTAATPPVTFEYSPFAPEARRYQTVAATGGDLPPRPFADANLSWADLFGNALPDIIQTTPTGLRYWRNTGEGVVDRPRVAANSPAGVMLAHAGTRSGDVEGDGAADLVVSQPLAGFYRTDGRDGFQPFSMFDAVPAVDPRDPNVRFVDLTGDGLADVLVSREHHFLWFPCLGTAGYGPPRAVEREHDLEAFPDVGFEDAQGRIRLVDMNGDGLADLVYVHDGHIDYWPSLGYGRFGARVRMARAPLIGAVFDPKRLFLTDLDGSGCADAVYVEHGRVRFWLNQSGNGFSDERAIEGTPPVTPATHLQCLDLFGTGTATLMWSYDADRYPAENIKVLDVCGGQKPYLATAMSNHSGATTRVRYVSSTRCYLQDARERTPWVTRLPFPVQVVDTVEVLDHLARTKVTSSYRYHHGYYDGREREFRGFGRVDQYDTQEFPLFSQPGLHGTAPFDNGQAAYHAPPALTKTWFHTGAYREAEELAEQYRRECYAADAQAVPAGPHAVTLGDRPWEAMRALRGALLRSEVYGADGTSRAAHPYAVTESSYTVAQVQPAGGPAAHAVFLTTPRSTVIHHYERDPADPRVTQQLTLRVDAFGNVTDALQAAYPRRAPQDPEQAALRVTYEHRDVINAPDAAGFHYLGVPCQRRMYEIHGLHWSWGDPPLAPGDVASLLDTSLAPSSCRPYEWQPPASPSGPEKRLLGWDRSYWRRDAAADRLDLDPAASPVRRLADRLPLGGIEALGLPYESYRLAFTTELLQHAYGREQPGGPWRVDAATLVAAGYHAEPDLPGRWWIPSGQQRFGSSRYYLPEVTRSPYGADAHATYDGYDLLVTATRDPAGNRSTAEHDYRLLQARRVTGPNGTVSEVAFDTLGYVVGSAVRGAGDGDSLAGFEANLDQADIEALLADPVARAPSLLKQATERVVYDLHRFDRTGEPNAVCTITRQRHAQAPGGGPHRCIPKLTYVNGLMRTLQVKAPAEPGDVAGSPVAQRWLGTGWSIVDNKERPVQQFEPFFSATHAYEPRVMHGVSDTLFYDPLGRRIAVLHPDATYEKTVRATWQEASWDRNDTVREDPRTDADLAVIGGSYLASLPGSFRPWLQRAFPGLDPARPPAGTGGLGPQQKAALVALPHAGTPAIAHFDVHGRAYRTLTSDGATVVQTRTGFDIEGHVLTVTDPQGLVTFRNAFDLAAREIAIESVDAGRQLLLPDVTGKPVLLWGADGHRSRSAYDALQRLVAKWVRRPGQAAECLVVSTVYGESVPEAAARNLRERIHQVRDEAGLLTYAAYDFKGNLLQVERTLAADYRGQIDWSGAVPMEPETFVTRHDYDALNRITETRVRVEPAGTEYVYRAVYSDAGLLDRVTVRLPGESGDRAFVTGIAYNEKAQRTHIAYGNGVTTDYRYDPLTLRLSRLTSRRGASATLQDLRYAYDPSGHVTSIHDGAFPAVFRAGQAIAAASEYAYDALYRLTRATGREHESMDACEATRGASRHTATLGLARQHANDGQAFRRYSQTYTYDASGNLERIVHAPSRGAGWTRRQTFETDAAGQPLSHRLVTSKAGCDRESTFTVPHDAGGRITAMPHLTRLDWDPAGHLRHVTTRTFSAGSADEAFYAYAGNGARVRKVIEQGGRRVSERVSLSGFEIYREFDASGGVRLERQTMQVMDDAARIALIETRTDAPAAGERRIRYQLANHVGSSHLEVDEAGRIISYEEYFPYGGSAYLAGTSLTEVQRKRYRYHGKERDDETGLYYYGARYAAPWLGRWISPDPIGARGGVNGYVFNSGDPIGRVDPAGLQDDHANEIHQPRSAVDSGKAISCTQGADYYRQQRGEPPAPMPKISLPEDKGPLGIVMGLLMIGGGVALAATLVGAPEGAFLMGAGGTVFWGATSTMTIASGVTVTTVSAVQTATAETQAEHDRFNEAKAVVGNFASPTGTVAMVGTLAATDDMDLAIRNGAVGSLAEGVVVGGASGVRWLADASRVSRAPSTAANLTRINLVDDSAKAGVVNWSNNVFTGRSENCGFVCVAEVSGLTVKQVAGASPHIPMGGTTSENVLELLESIGLDGTMMQGASRQTIKNMDEAKTLMQQYEDGTQFIIGYELRGQADAGHWVNGRIDNGVLVITDNSSLTWGTGFIPSDAIKPEVVIVGGGIPGFVHKR